MHEKHWWGNCKSDLQEWKKNQTRANVWRLGSGGQRRRSPSGWQWSPHSSSSGWRRSAPRPSGRSGCNSWRSPTTSHLSHTCLTAEKKMHLSADEEASPPRGDPVTDPSSPRVTVDWPLSEHLKLEAIGKFHQVDEEGVVFSQLQLVRIRPTQHRHGNLRFAIYKAVKQKIQQGSNDNKGTEERGNYLVFVGNRICIFRCQRRCSTSPEPLTWQVQFCGGGQVSQTPGVATSRQHKLVSAENLPCYFHFEVTLKSTGITIRHTNFRRWIGNAKHVTLHKAGVSPGASPVLVLLVKVRHNVQKATDEGAGRGRVGWALARALGRQHGAAPLRVRQPLLHLHVLLPEQSQMLLQLGHLLCPTSGRQKWVSTEQTWLFMNAMQTRLSAPD